MKIKQNTSKAMATISNIGLLAFSGAQAAVIINNSTDYAPAGGGVQSAYVPTAFNASSADLAQGLTATVTGNVNTTFESSAGASKWTDGSISTVYAESGPGGDAIDHAAYGTLVNGTIVTLDLGALFNLSRIDVFMGWNDTGRDDSSFTMAVSANGSTYTTIATYTKPADLQNLSPVTQLHSIVDDAGAAIATGVRYVQLTATNPDNGASGLVEIDVFAVPEPSAFALSALGALLGLGCRRRH